MKRLLDTLARWVCDPTETCVACCSFNSKTYLASNQKFPFVAQRNWENLSKLIKERSEENYFNLFKITALKIKSISKKQDFITIKENQVVRDFLQKLSTASESPFFSHKWLEAQQSAESLFQEMLKVETTKSKERNNYLKLLVPWQDLACILQQLENLELQKITQQKVVYVESESESEETFQGKSKKTHAEVKIVNHLYQHVEKQLYIGSSKLTCSHCQAILQTFKSDFWQTKGSHGQPERLCRNPSLVKLNGKVEVIQKQAEEIARTARQNDFISQTTSEFFDQLLNPIEIASEQLNNDNLLKLIQIN